MSDLVRREEVLALAEAVLSTSGEKERLVRLLAALPAALAAEREATECGTCGGDGLQPILAHGAVRGHRPCPDCAKETP